MQPGLTLLPGPMAAMQPIPAILQSILLMFLRTLFQPPSPSPEFLP